MYVGMEKPYFIYIQQTAACADTRVPQLYMIWKTENKKEINELKAKLNNKVQFLANLMDK